MTDEREQKLMPLKTMLERRRGDVDEMTETERLNVGRIIKAARRAKGYSQAQVAVAASCTPQALGLWEQGRYSTTAARMAAVGRFLDVEIEAAKRGISRPASATEMAIQPAAVVMPPADPSFDEEWMSVLGTQYLGGSAFVFEAAIAQIRRPPGLRQSKLVSAFNVPTDNMYPRYRIGEMVYVQRRIPAQSDDALVELLSDDDEAPTKVYLVEMVRMTAEQVFCRQHNPGEDLNFDRAKVKNLWRVLTIADLLGR